MLPNWYFKMDGAGDGSGGGGGGHGGQGDGGGDKGAGGGDGGAPPAFDWGGAGLDEQGVQLVNSRQWKGPADVVTSYRNLEKTIGFPPERIITLPEGNEPKDWDPVFKKLGRPDTAEQYVIPLPDGDDGAFSKIAGKWFHEAGMPQSMVTSVSEKWNNYLAETTKQQTEQAELKKKEDVKALEAEWGSQYEDRSKLVDLACTTFEMTQEQLSALKSALGPRAAMKFMYNIGSRVEVESNGLIDGDVPRKIGSMTKEEAIAEIKAKKYDKDYQQLFLSSDPKVRSETRQRWSTLHKIAYPEQ